MKVYLSVSHSFQSCFGFLALLALVLDNTKLAFRLHNMSELGSCNSDAGGGVSVTVRKQHQEMVEELRQLKGQVELLKCESNSRKVWLRHRLQRDKEAVARIRSMEENAGKELEAMVARLEAADAESKLLAEKLEKKASEEGREIPKFQ